jgi:hypothetical protein
MMGRVIFIMFFRESLAGEKGYACNDEYAPELII